MVKFAHIADCHLGSWSRKPELQELNILSFENAIDRCIEAGVDFIIIAGDFFDISFPTNTNVLSRVFSKLKELKEKNIPVFMIPGSHDFSASGESMLKVCESAGFCKNLMNLLDEKDGKPKLSLYKDVQKNILLTGILGKRIGLEIDIIKGLNKEEIEQKVRKEKCLKIFIVHTAISELLSSDIKNEHMAMVSYKDLPDGFNYYAAGHIHEPKIIKEGNKVLAYSGCIFPNNFSELAEIQQGSFILAEFDENTEKFTLSEEKIKLKEVVSIVVDAEDKTPQEIENNILNILERSKIADSILTLKVSGTLKSGKVSDINFEKIYKMVYSKGCFSFLRNTHGLSTKELEIEVSKADSVEKIEEEVIGSFLLNLDETERGKKRVMINSLLSSLGKEKAEDETKDSFSFRLVKEIVDSLNLRERF